MNPIPNPMPNEVASHMWNKMQATRRNHAVEVGEGIKILRGTSIILNQGMKNIEISFNEPRFCLTACDRMQALFDIFQDMEVETTLLETQILLDMLTVKKIKPSLEQNSSTQLTSSIGSNITIKESE
ncbi:hypothetical protein ACH5RR_001370 [Cinchona calisaya]|uniref:Uncharacterized protein n=1 Tax=Cinchona calisaya TaxID=153742 RepID=A0ABD3B3A7_9GENT